MEQSLLSPEAGVIKAEIERKISGVDGVICLIGPYYGTRLGLPPAEGQPTMSYTQYEWQMTTQDYKKQSLVYLVKDEFFSAGISSEVTPEDACSVHFRAWQDEFRSRLWHAPSEHHQRRVASPVELALALAKINWRQWPRE